MGFGRKSRHVIGGGGGAHGEDLMITPLLDLFTSLICFLVIGATLSKINIVEVGIAKPVANSIVSSDKDLGLVVKLDEKKADVIIKGRSIGSIQRTENEKWLNELHVKLVEIKKSHPTEFKIRIEPSHNVELETMMAVMDYSRKLRKDDPEIIHVNEKGEKIKLQYLFPNVVLRGVY